MNLNADEPPKFFVRLFGGHNTYGIRIAVGKNRLFCVSLNWCGLVTDFDRDWKLATLYGDTVWRYGKK